MSRYIREMTNGDGDERFEFGLDVLISGLAAVSGGTADARNTPVAQSPGFTVRGCHAGRVAMLSFPRVSPAVAVICEGAPCT